MFGSKAMSSRDHRPVMRVELDRRRCFVPEACDDCLHCVEAWDGFERGTDGGAVLPGIDGFASASVGRHVPAGEETDVLEAVRACPTDAIRVCDDAYEP